MLGKRTYRNYIMQRWMFPSMGFLLPSLPWDDTTTKKEIQTDKKKSKRMDDFWTTAAY